MVEEMEDRCRLCLSSEIIQESIFESKDHQFSISSKIMLCTGIMVSPEDGHSKYICKNCRYLLDLFFHFRRTCFKTYVTLSSSLKESPDHFDNHQPEEPGVISFILTGVSPEEKMVVSLGNEQEAEASQEPILEESDDLATGGVTGDLKSFQVGSYVTCSELQASESSVLQRFKCLECKNTFESMKELDEHWEFCKILITTTEESPTVEELIIEEPENIDHDQDDSHLEEDVDSELVNDNISNVRKSDKQLSCETCGQTFKQLWLLKKHIQVKHVTERPFSCSHCSKRFYDKYELKYHQRIHEDSEEFGCSICHKRFHRKAALKSHMRCHTGEKPFSCEVCHRPFAHSNSLNAHRRTHTGLKPYTCQYCSRTFSQYSAAKSHEEKHMGGQRMFQCDVCHRMLATAEDYAKHSLTHKLTVNHQCPTCNRSFSRLHELKMHNLRFHSGNKPHSCSRCYKIFPDLNSLEKHSKIHPSDTLFSCNLCPKTFRIKKSLGRHIKKHHKDQNISKCSDMNAVDVTDVFNIVY